jgi:hypothetical protein
VKLLARISADDELARSVSQRPSPLTKARHDVDAAARVELCLGDLRRPAIKQV